MGDKKHIDRLFQEHFKDFEVAPPDSVWNNIETELNKNKKKRRIIPIWWRYAGVAALFLMLLTVGGIYFNNTVKTQPNPVVDTKDSQTRSSSNENNTKIAVEQENSIQNKIENVSVETGKEASERSSTYSKESTITETITPTTKNENILNGTLNKKPAATKNITSLNNSQVVANNSQLINNAVNSNNSKNSNEVVQNKKQPTSTNKIQELKNNVSNENNSVAEDKKENKNMLSIEEALDKTKDEVIEEKIANKWRIAPNAAPVYFNTLGEGSSIDPQFNSNSKTGEFNMSYGINASYAVNEKLKVRSGINKVNLGYNTNNVVVYQSVGISSSSKALRNIDANSSGNPSDNISIISSENLNSAPNSFETTNTSINQAFGYIEIPLEIEYALVNKKIGVNVIGGFSSFFLSNNKIFSEAEGGSKTYIGEANNINNVSYSANFGVGLNYQVSKKIDLNVEPMFKYQINTFNNTSGDFKPYFIGVYTGFAIKF